MISESFRLGFFFAPIQLLQPGKKNAGTLEAMTFGNLPGFGGLTFKNRDHGIYVIYRYIPLSKDRSLQLSSLPTPNNIPVISLNQSIEFPLPPHSHTSSTHLKNNSEIGNHPQVEVKMKYL